MRALVVSDVHLRGGPEDARFLRFLSAARCDELVLLGDVFHHWWHWGDRAFPAYEPVLRALADFRVSALPGNHDFHAPEFLARAVSAATPATHLPRARLARTWDGARVHLSHGDEVDGSRGYELTTAVVRGRAFRAGVDAMPMGAAWTFLGALAGVPGAGGGGGGGGGPPGGGRPRSSAPRSSTRAAFRAWSWGTRTGRS
jgi:UDP-2,3-diacylglucosamine pyrophosphatase LpxH